MGHITEAHSPIAGNAIAERRAGPNNATVKQRSAPEQKAMRTLRLSNTFRSIMPRKHPAVSIPQNHDTSAAPVVCGSKPWYWERNFEIQSAVPCSEPT